MAISRSTLMSDFQVRGKQKLKIMKYKSILFAVFSAVLIFTACEKNVSDSKPSTKELAASIYSTPSFINFTKAFVLDFKNYADYYRVPSIFNNVASWKSGLQEAADNESVIEKVYARFGLSFEEAISRKNKVDNDLLGLFNQNKILLTYSETEVWEIIKEAINLGYASSLPEWKELKSIEANAGSLVVRTNAIGSAQYRVNKLDGGEVWHCLKDAAGFGTASLIGIGALQRLAADGIQQAVITVSKFLAKRAGWIGLAIMTIDFANCLYAEAQD